MSTSGADISSEFKIAEFSVSPLANTISRGTRTLRVRPKVMELLVYLARNAGTVIDKDRIMHDVWAGVFVTSEVLANAICSLRRIFEDSAREPRFIETIQKRGYRLIAPVFYQERPRIPTTTKKLTVGHGSESAVLRECLSSAVEGHGLLVCVSGEAGIGKTTLIDEFLLDDKVRGCFVGRGKCSECFEGTGAYLPILEALEGLVRADVDGTLVGLLMRTAPDWYIQIFPGDDESRTLAAQGEGSSQERMKRDLMAFLRQVSEIRPMLLFIDDLHWADASSVDILSYLCDRCPSMRILILVAYRPEFLLSGAHTFLGVKLGLQAHGVCREIKLSLLSGTDIAMYIDNVFPDHRFPKEFAESIYHRTEGNPLFTVDLLEHLRDQGVILRDTASFQWHLAGSISETECGIPASVHSLIDRKLRMLSELDRRILDCACIQGYEFDSAVVTKSLGSDATETEERLAALDHVHGFIRLIREIQRQSQIPTLRYQFVHVLYQNALAEALSPSRRASLSAAMARALLEVHGDRGTAAASQVAMLFNAAHDPSRAAGHYLVAAQHAIEVSADREAVVLARSGLSLLGGIPESAERRRLELFLQMILGNALIRLFGYADSGVKEAHSRAYALCRDSEDNIEIYRALMGLGAYHIFRSDLVTGRDIWERINRLSEASQSPLLLLWSHVTGCIILSHVGEQSAALEHARRASNAYNPKEHTAIVSLGGFDAGVIGRAQMARILWLCGYPAQARRGAAEALEMARQHTHPYTLALTLFVSGWTSRFLRDAAKTMERAAEARSIAEEYGFLMLQGWSEGLLGWSLACQGQLDEGMERLGNSLNTLGSIGCHLVHIEFLSVEAEVRAMRHETKEALDTLDKAFAQMRDGGERYYEAELYRTRAEILLKQARQPNTKVESLLRKSVDIARRQGSKGFELRAATSLSRLYLSEGRHAEAQRELRGILGWFREGLDTPDLRDAQELLGMCGR
ncbi:MAG TPA: AAA family ATPase [Acidobacteriota bacterium]|nr:AAA family ATPase [Acidobacteriota bacterium]